MMREHLKQGNNKLPFIANLVLYSGKQTPYPYSVDIYNCFESPDKARAMMFKPLALIDLGQMSEEELSRYGSADMLELLKTSQTCCAWPLILVNSTPFSRRSGALLNLGE